MGNICLNLLALDFLKTVNLNISMTSKQLLTHYFKNKIEVQAAYLYGSIITGKNLATSDVDIALLTLPYNNPIESFKARIRFQTEISLLIKKEVDLVFLREVGDILAFQILKTGCVIFESDSQIHRSYRAYRNSKYLDFQFYERQMQRGMIKAIRISFIGQ